MLWAEELSTQYQEQGAVSHGHCGVQVSAPLTPSHVFVNHLGKQMESLWPGVFGCIITIIIINFVGGNFFL